MKLLAASSPRTTSGRFQAAVAGIAHVSSRPTSARFLLATSGIGRQPSPAPPVSSRHHAATLGLVPRAPLGRYVGASQDVDLFGLEYVFVPSAEAADFLHSSPFGNPHPRGSAHRFWRALHDVLRHLTFQGYRGSYAAPGPNGRRTNIVRQPWPHGAGDPPVLHGGGVAHIPGRTPELDRPPFPPTDLPVALETLPVLPHPEPQLPPRHPLAAVGRPPIRFQGLPLKGRTPISYHQEVLFVGDSDEFINKAAAQAALRDVIRLMQTYRTVHVTIVGNAASNSSIPQWTFGGNRTVLMKLPSFVLQFPTVGQLMLARARAIANLLISRGIPASRVHYDLGQFRYDPNPAGAARKRRATIVIEDRR